MAENSKIEWCDHTFNPWRGCTKVAAGCTNCYADDLSKRNPGTLGIWGPNGTRVLASQNMWKEPIKWNKFTLKCSQCGDWHSEECDYTHCNCGASIDENCFPTRPRVFCASLADVFEDWEGPMHNHLGLQLFTINGEEWFTEGEYPECRPLTMHDVRVFLFNVIYATKNLDWLVLTKRPENIPGFIGGVSGAGLVGFREMYPNLWLGTSIANQADADRNIPLLLNCRDLAPVLFVSAEPLLGPVDLQQVPLPDAYLQMNGITGCATPKNDPEPDDYKYFRRQQMKLDWLIAGGESGHNARPMHPDWARSLRDQCQAADVPFLFKQWGEYELQNMGNCESDVKIVELDGTDSTNWTIDRHSDSTAVMAKVGKKAAGRLIDGREWNEYPVTKGVTNRLSS